MNISSHPFHITVIIVTVLFGCGEPLTPVEKETIARDGVLISVCQSKGRECKRTDGGDCFGVYDDCMLDGGLREASAR